MEPWAVQGMKAEQEQMHKLEADNMASPVNQSVSEQGIKVTALQSIVDNYYVHLAFKVEGYEPEAGKQPDFEDVQIRIDGQNAPDGEFSISRGSTTVWFREMTASRICRWDAAPGGRTFGKICPGGTAAWSTRSHWQKKMKGIFYPETDFCRTEKPGRSP
ncbi:MAG: DUF4179 domain-containing protein [Blautia marasmi]